MKSLGLVFLGIFAWSFNTCEGALVQLYDGNGLPANQAWLAYASDSIFTEEQPPSRPSPVAFFFKRTCR